MSKPLRSALNQLKWLRRLVFRWQYYSQRNRKVIRGENNCIHYQLLPGLPKLKRNRIKIIGENNSINIGSNSYLSDLELLIEGCGNSISIESSCNIASGSIWIRANNARIRIGKKTTIVDANIGIAGSKSLIDIGEDCMLSHGIDIRCGDSHAIIDLNTGKQLNRASYIKLEKHVWLGMHSRVLKDVTVGENSIIAAGSIATKSVPRNCIAAGIPATVKRRGVTWSREVEASLEQIGTPLNRVSPVRILHTLASQHHLTRQYNYTSPTDASVRQHPIFQKMQQNNARRHSNEKTS